MKKIYAQSDELNFPHSELVISRLKNLDVEWIRRYQKEPELLSILAQKHKVQKNFIFLESGILGLIHRVLETFSNRKAKILLPKLGYPPYFKISKQNNYKINTFGFIKENNRFYYNIADIKKQLLKKPDIIVLIDPESPLGFSLKEKDLISIMRSCPKETLIILDQEHEGFRDESIKDIGKFVNEYPNLLVARSFSKFYGLAGLRIAYSVVGKNVKKMINFNDRYLGFCRLSQQLAIACLESIDHYQKNAVEIRKQKNRFLTEIDDLPGYDVYHTDNHASILQIPIKHKDLLLSHANDLGIHLRDLNDYTNELNGFIRITCCPEEEMDRIIDLIKSVSWIMDMKMYNSDAESIINTRKSGYTVHRKEMPCKKSKLTMGFHRVIIPPDKFLPKHRHLEQDEIFEFHSRAIFELNDSSFEVKAGDIVNIKPGDFHLIKPLHEVFARFVVMRFPYKKEKKQGTYDPEE